VPHVAQPGYWLGPVTRLGWLGRAQPKKKKKNRKVEKVEKIKNVYA
jgi:hypothetical protein